MLFLIFWTLPRERLRGYKNCFRQAYLDPGGNGCLPTFLPSSLPLFFIIKLIFTCQFGQLEPKLATGLEWKEIIQDRKDEQMESLSPSYLEEPEVPGMICGQHQHHISAYFGLGGQS